MSFDLSQLRFTVDTKQLDDAITKVGNLATSVVALNKPLSKLGSDSKATAGDIDTTTKAVNTNTQAVKTNQSILERQEAILNKMTEGWSKGQSSILASAKASGIANTEMQKLESTLASQRKLLGNDPFDKSASGLTSLTQGLGAAREGYRQMMKFQDEFNRLQKEGKGEELRLVSLNKKETDSLYRDKQRMIEQYKILKSASFDASNTEMIDKQKNAYKDLVQNVKNLEATYKQVATAKRPLDNLRTVDSTKRRDELNYLARATSVQLGDVGISLAGGQNPLTVFLQQGDQLRGVFNQVGASGTEMKEALSKAFSQIVVGFVEVGKVMGTFVVGAIADASKAIVKFTLDSLGVTTVLGYLREKLVAVAGESSAFVRAFDKIGSIASGAITAGVLGLTTVLIGLAVAYAKILPVQQELNAALLQNGASLATSSKDAMQFAAAMSSVSGTSLDYAKVITEIATAGNLSKESIEGITISAIEMNRYLGVATKDVVAQYSKLADDPVKALTEIGTATGRVTAETIDHIRELVEQGKKTEAVSEANRELDRAYAEMSASARDSMTPLGKLWDDMKGSINELIEAVYAFAQTDGAINVLSTVWQTLKVAISEVLFVIRGVGRELGGLAAQGAAIAKGDFTGAGRIGDMMKSDAEEARKAQDAYTASIIKGADARKVVSQIELNGLKVNRDQIKARAEIEKLEDKFGTKSVLTATQRLKKISDAKAQVDEQLAKSGLSAKDVELKRRPLYANIEESFKDKKKGSGAGAAIRDSISAEQKQIENDRKESEREAKMSLDRINSEHKRGLINDYDYASKKADIEKQALQASIGFYNQEISFAKKKVNSLKEVQELEGKIRKANSDIKDKELEKEYAQLEFTQKLRAAVGEEIKALDDKTKAQRLENELIGKTAEQISVIKGERLDHVIALQKEHVEYMLKNGYSESSAQAYDFEKAKLDALIASRKVNIDALNAETAAAIAKSNAANSDAFNKDMGGLDKQQKDLDFREKLIGKTQEQKDAMKRAYEVENQLQDVRLKQQEAINDAKAEYNRLVTENPSMKEAAGASLELKTSRANALAERQAEIIKQGANLAEKELNDAKLEKFSEGIADALVTGMNDGAKAGKKKLRDLIVAELTKTITLNIQANIKSLLSGGGSSGGGILDSLFNKGVDYLTNSLFGGASGAGISAGVEFAGVAGGNAVSTTGLAGIEAASAGITGLAEASALAAPAIAGVELGIGASTTAALAAIPVWGWMAAGALALFAIFGSGGDKIPTVLNDLALFNNSLIGLPFLDIAIKSDEAAQGLRDVMYGLENASPTMRKLAGETLSLSVELLRASGDIAGAANLARNIGTRGMSEAEIEMYDYNQSLKDQIEAARAGQAASQAAAQAEEQLAKTRWDLAGKLNILLGRTTQKEFDRATQLAATTDASSLEMLKLIFMMEDLTAAVDSQYATLERSIGAERKLAEARLTSATALQGVLKTAKDATTTLMTRGNAQLSLTRLLAIARATGVLPSVDAMQPLLDALTAPSEDLFSTFEDYQRDFLKTAYNITEMANLADDQVSLEQKTLDKLDAQLEQAKAQLDALKGVDTSVKDVATAIKDFDAAMRALGNAKSSTGTYNYSAPVTGGSGGSSGAGSSGSGASNGKPTFEDIAGQENKDIVAAYREYYNRNPDESGYKNFLDSKLTGDKLMQAILGASAIAPDSADFKMAMSKGYDPLAPLAKFYKPKAYTAGGNVEIPEFDVGINRVPSDMYAKVHKDERILPAADNRELFARLQNPQDNAVVMAAAITRLTDEVKLLRAEQRQTVINTGKTAESFKYMTNENGTALNVVIET